MSRAEWGLEVFFFLGPYLVTSLGGVAACVRMLFKRLAEVWNMHRICIICPPVCRNIRANIERRGSTLSDSHPFILMHFH